MKPIEQEEIEQIKKQAEDEFKAMFGQLEKGTSTSEPRHQLPQDQINGKKTLRQ
ncbi:MAG: hypothetical protein P4L42_16960 [Desulfocapsaceae bacterium]|nr:hypothetical protein [Desulfocapsaceae bacterium]